MYGVVTDESGAVLPGAAVTITSDLGNRSTTTGTQGEFRFLNLDRGQYKVTVAIAGFSTLTREITVTTGENVNLTFSAKVAQQEETITVTAETPLVDTKKRGTGTTLTTEELTAVPNARDPWGVLRNVPGVLLDRVNIAGNENGQQASVAGKGSPPPTRCGTWTASPSPTCRPPAPRRRTSTSRRSTRSRSPPAAPTCRCRAAASTST